MIKRLAVYLHRSLAGWLDRNAHGELSFSYESSYLLNKASQPLSLSLPLTETVFDNRQCRPFFNGILPESDLRTTIARQLGISEKNDFALLEAIGGECAGAVSVLPPDAEMAQLKADYRILTPTKLIEILKTMHQRPMIAGEDGIRLSLAGAQDKLPVALIDGHIAIPTGGAPSTHILKPVNHDFPTLIANEHFCMKLARKIGLNAAHTMLHEVSSHTYLLVERYDRLQNANGIIRLHQEDFCQAMGINSEMKYQREGGPGISQCFELLRNVSTLPALDLKMLLRGVFFNLIIGNNDAHGKNFSLLYNKGQVRLAPFYDLISTVHYPELANRMAMKIGSKYDFNALMPRHIQQLAEQAGLSGVLVRKELLAIIDKIQQDIETSEFTQQIIDRAHKLLERDNHFSK